MCESPDLSRPDARESSPAAVGSARRDFLRRMSIGGAAVVGAGMFGLGAPPAEAASAGRRDERPFGPLEVVLLGTQAGPPPDATRAGISSALVVDGATYLIDCGRSAVTQYQRAGLKYSSLRNIFLTHLHADHIADYYNFLMLSGLPSTIDGDMIPAGVGVYGPGPAGALPDPFGGRPAATISPDSPTPGTAELTSRCDLAYAYSTNVFMRDNGMRDIRTLRTVTEIAVPEVGASARGNTAPAMRPFHVMEDDRVRVTAILVPHGPVFPSFAFRFDTDHGSVTFSGDTRRSENVVALAAGSDLLIHEALGDPTAAGLPPAVLNHMLESHTLVSEVGAVAQDAGVPHLALSHIGDFGKEVNLGQWTRLAGRGYDGRVTVGTDLMRLPVSHRTRSTR